MLDGLVDIFLPDLKYFDSRLGEKYSGVPKYFEYASEAIRTMFAMTGPARIGDDGLSKRGMIIRHLVLPWQWRDSCRCLDWIHETFGDNVFVSVMTLKSSKAPTNYFTPNILRKSWSRLVVSVVHLDALAFPVAAT